MDSTPPAYDASARKRSGRGKIYDSIVDTIGDTPLVRLPNLTRALKPKGTVLAKLEGVKDSQMDARVNKAKRNAQAKKGYLLIEGVQARDHITVKWTQIERSKQYEAAGKTYSGYWRGNTLLKMDPPGSLTPLYRQGHRVTTALPRHARGMIRETASI